MDGLIILNKAAKMLEEYFQPGSTNYLTHTYAKNLEGKLVKVWFEDGKDLENENENSVDPKSYYLGQVSVFPESIIINYKDGTTEKRYFKHNWPEWSIKIY